MPICIFNYVITIIIYIFCYIDIKRRSVINALPVDNFPSRNPSWKPMVIFYGKRGQGSLASENVCVCVCGVDHNLY